MIGFGGWDMHDNLLNDHAQLLRTVSQAISAISIPPSANSATFRMSEQSFLVKPTLPAPMIAILKLMASSAFA